MELFIGTTQHLKRQTPCRQHYATLYRFSCLPQAISKMLLSHVLMSAVLMPIQGETASPIHGYQTQKIGHLAKQIDCCNNPAANSTVNTK